MATYSIFANTLCDPRCPVAIWWLYSPRLPIDWLYLVLEPAEGIPANSEAKYCNKNIHQIGGIYPRGGGGGVYLVSAIRGRSGLLAHILLGHFKARVGLGKYALIAGQIDRKEHLFRGPCHNLQGLKLLVASNKTDSLWTARSKV